MSKLKCPGRIRRFCSTSITGRVSVAMEADRQLNDNFHYEQIDEVNLENTHVKVNEIINKMQNENCIDEMSLKYIRNEQGYAKKPFAYFLPKIHKLESEILHTIENEDKQVTNINVPGRPILSCNQYICCSFKYKFNGF